MLQETVSSETKNDLEILTKAGIIKDYYLAGGTGLAFQLKHRLSIDLDFFSNKDIDTKMLIQNLKNLGKISVEKESQNSMAGYFNSTLVSFIKYDYPCLFAFKEINGVSVADPRDIGCMKIDAISSRGTKRDFIDLFFICKLVLPAVKLLNLFKKKYVAVNFNMIHILKSLLYFEDAEKEPLPKMIKTVSWDEVKEFFLKEFGNIKL
ncbi:MAG: nucleotidyl transferase AbiEii/AbiGii toxin family protein [Actinobacteria bacterium]|nr:nucleotidyl transferase AbiEii/AbiGii toxin family protein [Actinomycetota bacterium]